MPIYREPVSEWSADRLHFFSWLVFYDRVYNVPDGAPPQNIIDNDVLLDKWIDEYNLKKKAERTGKGKKVKSAKDHKHSISFNTGDD